MQKHLYNTYPTTHHLSDEACIVTAHMVLEGKPAPPPPPRPFSQHKVKS